MTTLTDADLRHLRRCVALAREALEDGAEPVGAVLVDADGAVRAQDRNRTADGDQTRHPEFELARWSATNLTPDERAGATVYTSGEHCPMCSAAHAWVGLARIVYVASTEQLIGWRTSFGLTGSSPVNPLPVNAIAPGVVVGGPAPELEDEIRELHRRHAEKVLGGG
ncbi:MAG: nucleoside deaminase [Lapillicoccus sp.]